MPRKKNELTTRELEKIFNVTNRTVVNWREGSARITPLPTHAEERAAKDRIYFKSGEVKKWAKLNQIEIVVPVEVVIGLRKKYSVDIKKLETKMIRKNQPPYNLLDNKSNKGITRKTLKNKS